MILPSVDDSVNSVEAQMHLMTSSVHTTLSLHVLLSYFFSNFSLVKIIWTVRKQLWSWYIRNIFCPDNLLYRMNPVKGEGRYADDWTQRNSCSFLKDCTVYSHCSLEQWQVNSCGRSVRSAPHCNLQMHAAQTVHWPRSCIRSRNSCRCFLVFQIQLFPRNFPLNNENNASCVKNIKLLCSMCIGMVLSRSSAGWQLCISENFPKKSWEGFDRRCGLISFLPPAWNILGVATLARVRPQDSTFNGPTLLPVSLTQTARVEKSWYEI